MIAVVHGAGECVAVDNSADLFVAISEALDDPRTPFFSVLVSNDQAPSFEDLIAAQRETRS